MSLLPHEQFKKFLDNSKEVLILIPENPSADAVGSAWALYFFLEKKGLIPTIVFSNNLSAKFSFLPKPDRILTEISGARDFVLSFDIARNRIKSIRHEEQDGKFNIYLTPERGAIDPRDFSFILAKFKYDLIIVIDSPDLEKLGRLYNDNTDLFFEVPVVNIDHRSNNDNFGQINLVDVTLSSCAEIAKKAMETIDENAIDQSIATCILAGIIGATDSFQKKNTTPKSLLAASELMEKGANQQEIIRWLYKTQPFHVIKLLGRAMAKVNLDAPAKFIWSELHVEDFVQSRASFKDLPVILEKLEENYSEGQVFAAIYNDTPSTSIAVIRTLNPEMVKKIYLDLGGNLGRGILEWKIDKGDLEEVGKALAQKIRKITGTEQ